MISTSTNTRINIQESIRFIDVTPKGIRLYLKDGFGYFLGGELKKNSIGDYESPQLGAVRIYTEITLNEPDEIHFIDDVFLPDQSDPGIMYKVHWFLTFSYRESSNYLCQPNISDTSNVFLKKPSDLFRCGISLDHIDALPPCIEALLATLWIPLALARETLYTRP